jgi:hypothetical protein
MVMHFSARRNLKKARSEEIRLALLRLEMPWAWQTR